MADYKLKPGLVVVVVVAVAVAVVVAVVGGGGVPLQLPELEQNYH